jgi:hypothetical protein
MNWKAHAFSLGVLSGLAYSTATLAVPPQLETKSLTIPSVEPGIELYMRNKHPVGTTAFGPHAATTFDLPIEGVSMMDLIAHRVTTFF